MNENLLERTLVATVLLLSIVSWCYASEGEKDSEREQVYCEISKSKLRAKPQFWAPAVADIEYGDPLFLIEEDKSWVEVETSVGKQGFLPLSAVTKKKVVVQGKSVALEASAAEGDIVLAGKGFNSKIEGQYSSDHVELNYQAVDKMQSLEVSPEEMVQFIEMGRLR